VAYASRMRLPQIQSAKAVLLIAALITLVTWGITLWGPTSIRTIPAGPPRPVERTGSTPVYVDINMGAKPQPAPAPAP
jgi:hypothetical protein